MANRAYLDRAADVRFRFFANHGFEVAKFASQRIGPAIVHDDLSYRHELRLGETFTVDLRARALSADGSRFILENTFRSEQGEVVAVVTSEGVWFDLDRRKPRAPPADLDAVQRRIPRAEGFAEIPARGVKPGVETR